MAKEVKPEVIPVVIELPKPSLTPTHGRIYAKGFKMDDVKTKGGIFLATSFTKMAGENSNKQWEFQRYFVLAVAPDVTIGVFDKNLGKNRIVRRGDELAIPYHEDALKYEPAQIMDFDAAEKFIVFHETEIVGVKANTIVEKDE